MNKMTEDMIINQISKDGICSLKDAIVKEFALTIFLNRLELVTLFCSPSNLECLVVGFLVSEGIIRDKNEIRKITIDEGEGTAIVTTKETGEASQTALFKRRLTSGGMRGVFLSGMTNAEGFPPIESNAMILPDEVFQLMDHFVQRSAVFRNTGGVHSAALCDRKNILVFNEDIGRHNAIDKVFGECMLKDIPDDNRMLLTSGRVSSEIVLKVAKRGVPILISKSAPTNSGIKLAADLGVTLLGFVRGKKMNVYAHDERIITDGI